MSVVDGREIYEKKQKALQHLKTILAPDFQLFEFGSFTLRTDVFDSDIDILAGCLNGVGMQECVGILRSNDIHVDAEIQSTINLVKCKVDEIPIDITFATLSKPATRKTLMQCIEPTESAARAVNGVLVSDWIRQNIPNFVRFQQTVVRVKKWAIASEMYGTMLGFPGGMAWTLMVAKMFQTYDTQDLTVDECFHKFLWYYRYWNWPTPVILASKYDPPVTEKNKYKNWNPYKYARDSCFMAVITPVYPTMNSCYGVTEGALKYIQSRFRAQTDEEDYDWNDNNYFLLEMPVPENDDGTWKLKLRGICNKIGDLESVKTVHPFMVKDVYEKEKYFIKVFYTGSVDFGDIMDEYDYTFINHE